MGFTLTIEDSITRQLDIRNEIVQTFQQGDLQGRQVQVLTKPSCDMCHCHIVPPSLTARLTDLLQNDEHEEVRTRAAHHRDQDNQIRQLRTDPLRPFRANTLALPVETVSDERSIMSAVTTKTVPGVYVYTADKKELSDEELPGRFLVSNKAYRNTGDLSADYAIVNTQRSHKCFFNAFGQNGMAGTGDPFIETIHYGMNYANAFYNGWQLVFGDGDDLFGNFIEFITIVAHEIWHGVTGNRLVYFGESGALNEHYSDVFAVIAKQYTLGLSVDQDDWLIAKGIFKGYPDQALRSMREPGKAYSFKIGNYIIEDDQPDHYSRRYTGTEDNGGVHINSGIPNKAFYLFTKSLGGYTWRNGSGLIWFKTLKGLGNLKRRATMAEFAQATINSAKALYPTNRDMHEKLLSAWKQVGVIQ